jgi:uncharacterized protein DUF397
MNTSDLAGAEWRTSSFTESGSCIEVAQVPPLVGVRDSKHPGPILNFRGLAWESFIRTVVSR